jgi:CubicO group peptidase (beta-lactamase class C family)
MLTLAALVLGVPAAGGMSQTVPDAPPAALAAAVGAAADLPRLHSLLVSWRGELVLERYFNGTRASRPANVKSVSKSVISALVGIAIDQKHIEGVRQPIAEFFPGVFAAAADAPKRQIAIEDLLTMRSGLESTSSRNYGAWVRSRDWVRYALARPLLSPPGTEMDYSTGNSHVLSAIIAKATRKTTRQFAQQVLAGPLGFTLAEWPRDPQGVYFGGNDMLLTPKQMVAFGELYLNGGRVDGRQIVPASWIDASFVPRARSHWSDQLYGYGWWIREVAGHTAAYAWGYGGQFIFVVPDLRLVVVATSSTATDDTRRSHRRTVQEVIEQFVIEPIASATASAGPPSTTR